jgi:beta-glucanase (GH16 family)
MKQMLNLIAAISLFAMCSCAKDSGTNYPQSEISQFVINTSIATDGSGVVDFNAKAPNATSYIFEFGDGFKDTTADGVTRHQYRKAGTVQYPVTVRAIRSGSEALLKTTEIRVFVDAVVVGQIWAEEFDLPGSPDATKWTYEIGTGNNGWGNDEKQYYTNRSVNSSVQGGVLRITAQKEDFQGSAYTSARLISKGKFEFKYGKVEIRAKLPQGGGTWPAVWMLGNDISSVGWPACGEIDIMEHVGNQQNRIFATLHYPGRSGGNADGNSRLITNASTEFHIYSLDWSANTIAMFVDGQLIHSVKNTGSIPFNKNFFFILNVAMGGNFGGAIDPAFSRSSMEIDYIRVSK